jgi:hypothetical protein
MTQSLPESWYGAVSFSLGGERTWIERAEVDRLVRALRQSELVPAISICEEITARALTGRVDLCLTEAELDALVATLERLRGITADTSALRRLLALGRASPDHDGSADAGGATPPRALEAGESLSPFGGRTDEL